MPVQALWLNLALQPETTSVETTEMAGKDTKNTSTGTQGTREGGDWLRSILSIIGPAIGLVTALLSRIRQRGGIRSEITDPIPIARAGEVTLPDEEERRDPVQWRRRQRRLTLYRGWSLVFYTSNIVLLPAIWRAVTQNTLNLISLLDSYWDLLVGLYDRFLYVIEEFGMTGTILGMIGYVVASGLFIAGYTYFFNFLSAQFRASRRLRRAPIGAPSEWCKQTEIIVDGPCGDSSALIPFRRVFRNLGSKITEIDVDQHCIKARQGSQVFYDEVTLSMEQMSDNRCRVQVTIDDIRPTIEDDEARHVSYLRRFNELAMG